MNHTTNGGILAQGWLRLCEFAAGGNHAVAPRYINPIFAKLKWLFADFSG
jgi:hypothetical protein